jgi:hypothetical protein
MTSLAYAIAEFIAWLIATLHGIEIGVATSGVAGWPV